MEWASLPKTVPPWPGRVHWSYCPSVPWNLLLSPNPSSAPAGKHLSHCAGGEAEAVSREELCRGRAQAAGC